MTQQFSSVCSHLSSALDCIAEQWNEVFCEIVDWESCDITPALIRPKIEKLQRLRAKLQLILATCRTIVGEQLSLGEHYDDATTLKSEMEIYSSLDRNLEINIEMLEAFAARKREFMLREKGELK